MTDPNAPKITDWAQACCALFGFGVLVWYAIETRLIRKATLAQSDASRRPFFVISTKFYNDGRILAVRAKNVGSGHSLHVKVTSLAGVHIQDAPDGIAVPIGEDFLISLAQIDSPLTAAVMEKGIRLEYEDMAGKQYWTIFAPTDPDIPDHFVLDSGDAPKPSVFAQLDAWSKRGQDL